MKKDKKDKYELYKALYYKVLKRIKDLLNKSGDNY